MLSHIHLRNFAIIEETVLDLQSGLTVLTGETGAGKSILIDAIGLVLGDRADSGVVRHGCEKTEITLSVDVCQTPTASAWLKENDLDRDDECILRRVITSKGKSRAWINGVPCNLGMLKALGEQLVDIHGQHEHQSLMKREFQRQLVDDFAGNQKLLEQLAARWREWKDTAERLQTLQKDSQEYHNRVDLLSFQAEELNQLGLTTEEINTLDGEHARLSNADEILQTVGHATTSLYEDEQSLYSRLSSIIAALQQQLDKDNSLGSPLEMIQSAQIQLQEAAQELRHYQDNLEIDPQRLDYLSGKLGEVQTLSRKHHVLPEELPARLEHIKQELAALRSDEYDLEALQARLDETASSYLKLAEKLGQSRKKAAARLSADVSEAMQQLGMQGGCFEIDLSQTQPPTFTPHGIDTIDFRVSANPGQPLKPLVKVASGGELSRISLAIQMIAAQKLTLPALIFDEVDTGIGGGIAEIVGRELRALGQHRQVLCVTHLPQVASQAHHHNRVSKTRGTSSTTNEIIPLDKDQRVSEVARMMGGVEITKSTLQLALEMIDKAAAS